MIPNHFSYYSNFNSLISNPNLLLSLFQSLHPNSSKLLSKSHA